MFEVPVVLVIGSTMSAGKTSTARVVIRLLKQFGLRIMGAKLTGAGRYHDILAMADAGADVVFDFVDAGLPSTICPADAYREAMTPLLGRMAELHADVAVVETGASPLEPYNTDTAIALIEDCVRMTILCTCDPYAALGVMTAFNLRPDLVTGVATNTDAGIALIEKLTRVEAMNMRDTKPGLASPACCGTGWPSPRRRPGDDKSVPVASWARRVEIRSGRRRPG